MRFSTLSFVTLLVLFFQHTVNAQPDSVWARIFDVGGWDECYDLIPTAEGGFGLIGYSLQDENLEEQIFFVETDENGSETNTVSYGSAGMDMAAAILPSGDGGYLIGGWSVEGASGEQDFHLRKTFDTGQTHWSRCYGGASQERCRAMQRDDMGNIVMAGYTSSFGNGLSDFWLVCVSLSGDSLWSRTYGSSELDYCNAMIHTSDSGYLLAGYTGSNSHDDDDFLVVKTDSQGNLVWQRTYGGDGSEKCYSVVEFSDGGYLLVGETSSFGEGGKDSWIVKISASGDSLWSRAFGGINDDYFRSACPLPDGGFILGGRTDSFAQHESDIWIFRIDHEGYWIWNQIFQGRSQNSWDECTKIIRTSDGGFVIAGTTGCPPGEWQDSDFILYKTSPDPFFYHTQSPVTVENFNLTTFPNPFNAITTIRFTTSVSQSVTLTVYDLQGRKLSTLFDGRVETGAHSVSFDGSQLASGTYFVNLNTGKQGTTEQLILLK